MEEQEIVDMEEKEYVRKWLEESCAEGNFAPMVIASCVLGFDKLLKKVEDE